MGDIMGKKGNGSHTYVDCAVGQWHYKKRHRIVDVNVGDLYINTDFMIDNFADINFVETGLIQSLWPFYCGV